MLGAVRESPMKLPLFAGALALVLPTALLAQPPLRIVCIGDSVTKAVRPGVKAEETFCAIVEARLKTSDKDAVVVNSGVGSDTTEGGLKRFERDVLAHKPTHVFIMFGLNDAWVKQGASKPLVALDRYAANLKQMIAILRSKKITPILMTSNPYNRPAPNVEVKPYIEACRKVAREENVLLVDVYARFAELAIEGDRFKKLFVDECHMNAEGNVFIADQISAALALAVKP